MATTAAIALTQVEQPTTAMEVDVATETAAKSPAAPTLQPDVLSKMKEFEKIVQFRDSVTAGTHPRIKTPAHLISVIARSPMTASGVAPRAIQRGNAAAHQVNRSMAATGKTTKGLPGLGRALQAGTGEEEEGEVDEPQAQRIPPQKGAAPPARPGFDPALLEKSDSLIRAEFNLKRARIERLLQDSAEAQPKKDDGESGAEAGPNLTDILQKARELELTFTPVPPSPPGNRKRSTTKRDELLEDEVSRDGSDTFYSSKFSTPEFGLVARVPAKQGQQEEEEEEEEEGEVPTVSGRADSDDAASVHSSSDYEPELDPDPPAHAQAVLQQPPQLTQDQGLALALARVQACMHPVASHLPWESSHSRGYAGDIRTTDSGPMSKDESSYLSHHRQTGRQPVTSIPRPPSPFVRTHNLSPVAPQPAHVTSLAVAAVTQLPLRGQETSRPSLRSEILGAPAQVAALRLGEASHSSTDGSTPGSGAAEKRKSKKKANNKRKAATDRVLAASPRIKIEPRSESPVLMPPAPRPYKRQRQASGHGPQRFQNGGAGGGASRYDGEADSPSMHTTQPDGYDVASRLPRSAYDGRTPVVYERVHGVEQSYPPRRRDCYGYEPSLSSGHPPSIVRAGRPPSPPPSDEPSSSGRHITHHYNYAMPPGPTKAVSLAAVATSPHVARYAGGYPPGVPSYDTPAGPMSVRPDPYVVQDHSQSPVMAPPSTSHVVYHRHPASPPPPPAATTRTIVDEYGREYYEPVRPPPPRSSMARQDVGAQRLRYASEVVYERPLSSRPLLRYTQPVSNVYDEGGVSGSSNGHDAYGPTSPVFVAPRRVVTQSEYIPEPASGGPSGYARDHTEPRPVLPPPPSSRVPAPSYTYYGGGSSGPPPPPPQHHEHHPVDYPSREYVVRASTARPAEGDERIYYVGSGGGPTRTPAPAPAPVLVREYSMRPASPVMVQRAYSVRPGAGTGAAAAPPASAYYVERVPATTAAPAAPVAAPPGYGYGDGGTLRQGMYR